METSNLLQRLVWKPNLRTQQWVPPWRFPSSVFFKRMLLVGFSGSRSCKNQSCQFLVLFSYELRTEIWYISSKQQPFFCGISHTTTNSKAQYGQSEKLQSFCQSYCFEWRSRALNNQEITFHFEAVSINFNAWLPSENLILNLLVETFIGLEYCHAVFYRVIISCKVNIVLSQEQQYIDMFSALKWINSGHG